MKAFIKSASVYAATLPSAEALAGHLEKHPFHEVTDDMISALGFVPNPETGELVTTFVNGYAFSLRYDAKAVPASAVRRETEKRIKSIEDDTGYRLSKVERKDIKEQVTVDLIRRVPAGSTTITLFYSTTDNYLFVPTTSQKMADRVMSKLVHAVESIKTTTINVSDAALGLTTKLGRWLDEDGEAFGLLDVTSKVKMKRAETKENIVYDLEDLDEGSEGIKQALASGFSVVDLGLAFGEVHFRLTSDFKLRSISFTHEADDDDTEQFTAWKQEAYAEVEQLSQLTAALCNLFEYKEPANGETA